MNKVPSQALVSMLPVEPKAHPSPLLGLLSLMVPQTAFLVSTWFPNAALARWLDKSQKPIDQHDPHSLAPLPSPPFLRVSQPLSFSQSSLLFPPLLFRTFILCLSYLSVNPTEL